jgi:mRNA interferase RelE/StbE
VSLVLRISPRAERQLGALDRQIYQRVKARLEELSTNPRPSGCSKLKEREGWRIRSGDYRVLYDIDDTAKIVRILDVGHRREIYR